jgi:hypothetical protein
VNVLVGFETDNVRTFHRLSNSEGELQESPVLGKPAKAAKLSTSLVLRRCASSLLKTWAGVHSYFTE